MRSATPEEPVILEEGANNSLSQGRCGCKIWLLRTGIETGRKFLEHAAFNELLDAPINRRGPARQVGTTSRPRKARGYVRGKCLPSAR